MHALGIPITHSLGCRSRGLESGSAVMHEALLLDSTDAPSSNVGLTLFSYSIYVRRKCRGQDSVTRSGARIYKKGARTRGGIRVGGRHRSRRFDSIARAPVSLLLWGLPRGRSVEWAGWVALPSLGPVGDLKKKTLM